MAGDGKMLLLCVTVDRGLGIESTLSVARGSTVLQVKQLLAESDPTGNTKVDEFDLGASPLSPGQRVVPFPDAFVLTEAHSALDLCLPAPNAVAETAPPGLPEDAAGPRWAVVGGSDKGGIVAREGRDLKSAPLGARLSTGSCIEEITLEGERLHYRRLTGSGPESGWVSISLGGRDLVVREGAEGTRANAKGTEDPAERCRLQIEAICACYADVVAATRSIGEEQQRSQKEGRAAQLDELLRKLSPQLAQCGVARSGAAPAAAPERLVAKLQEACMRLEEHVGKQAAQDTISKYAAQPELAPDGSEMYTRDYLGVARGACQRCRCCSWYRWAWDMSNYRNMRCRACDCPNTEHKSLDEDTGEMPGYYPGIDDEEAEKLEDMRFRVEQTMTWN
uniref:Uncharacterized protein n=1 Tax=Alexandrium catenella TaxID=2925 RepID=A0A7S1QM16_ALECA